ncbi:MAG: electron transfer flavoprotein beta subunit/FixA family protein [Actinomycetia bacterium]|nr:electron transfer flavoprotein beta subunit/FixA family protein [Actinomycetes bacterium]
MRVLVCVKRVPAPGSRINITDDEQDVDTAHLGFTTSPHEECALEEAVQIVEREGGEVVVLTVGPAEAEEQLRYAASVGGTSFVLVPTDGTALDPQRTASIITQAVNESESEGGQFDLILFGNESADSAGFQVGVRVAHALGRPMVNGIKGIEVGESTFTAQRAIDGGLEVYEVPRPAVLGILEGINLPRYPTMKGRLASRKAVIGEAPIDSDAGGLRRVRLHRPEETVSQTIMLPTEAAAAATAVVDLLEELGVMGGES